MLQHVCAHCAKDPSAQTCSVQHLHELCNVRLCKGPFSTEEPDGNLEKMKQLIVHFALANLHNWGGDDADGNGGGRDDDHHHHLLVFRSNPFLLNDANDLVYNPDGNGDDVGDFDASGDVSCHL